VSSARSIPSTLRPSNLRSPATILSIVGWTLTGLLFARYDPLFAAATLLLGVPLWRSDEPAPALAVTQVGMAVVTTNPPPATIALLEVGPVVLVVSLLSEDGLSAHTLGVATLLGSVLLGVTTGVLSLSDSVAVAAVALLCTATGISYVLFQYEAVVRELAVEQANTDDEEPTDRTTSEGENVDTNGRPAGENT